MVHDEMCPTMYAHIISRLPSPCLIKIYRITVPFRSRFFFSYSVFVIHVLILFVGKVSRATLRVFVALSDVTLIDSSLDVKCFDISVKEDRSLCFCNLPTVTNRYSDDLTCVNKLCGSLRSIKSHFEFAVKLNLFQLIINLFIMIYFTNLLYCKYAFA